jgi:hypothetical protein
MREEKNENLTSTNCLIEEKLSLRKASGILEIKAATQAV